MSFSFQKVKYLEEYTLSIIKMMLKLLCKLLGIVAQVMLV